MKKVIALLVALIMVFSSMSASFSAFAAEEILYQSEKILMQIFSRH